MVQRGEPIGRGPLGDQRAHPGRGSGRPHLARAQPFWSSGVDPRFNIRSASWFLLLGRPVRESRVVVKLHIDDEGTLGFDPYTGVFGC